MFESIGEGHKIMQRNIGHAEALWEAYDADPMQAVGDVLELTRQANELEDRIRELEAQRNWLAERIHRKNTVMYGKYPPTTKGWIRAAEERTAKEANK